jgi:hypothetical protein
MSDASIPTEEQQKKFAAANLSTPNISWSHAMTAHSINAELYHASDRFISTSERAAKILGIPLDKSEDRGDASTIVLKISGEDNLKKLAAAGGKFPGSDVYAEAALGKWVNKA